MTAVGNVFYLSWEVELMAFLQAHLSAGAMSMISLLSVFGEELVMVAVMGFLYWCYDKEFGKFVGLNMLCANVWGPMIKNVFLRLRPYFVSDRITLLRLIDPSADAFDVTAQGYSFPSGHSAGAVTVYGSLAARGRKKWLTVLAILLPLLVGFSRVAVGAHFPTDVLAGWALGLLVIVLVPWLRQRLSRGVFYVILLLIGLPGFFYCTSTDFYTSYGMLLGFVLAEPFEERFVRFENTRSPIRAVLRVVGGGGVYFALNTLLKLPFSSELLSRGDLAAHLIRTGRYAVVIFVVIAIYPMLFKLTARIGAKKEPEEKNENSRG